ncbi:MAG: hypothetical protein M3N08_00565 [Pseudomonadota bacterium]|nr:hypothetical protein [Pseudomonadota bacterium]
MIMADILFYVFVVSGVYVAIMSYWLASEALFPNFVEACRLQYETKPVRSFFQGLVVIIPLFGIGAALVTVMGNPVVQIAGFVIIFLLTLMGLCGSAGLCRQIGRGLNSPSDALQPWRSVLRGGAVLGFTFLLPLIGWFAVLPFTLISGVGSSSRVWLTNRSARPAERAGKRLDGVPR